MCHMHHPLIIPTSKRGTVKCLEFGRNRKKIGVRYQIFAKRLDKMGIFGKKLLKVAEIREIFTGLGEGESTTPSYWGGVITLMGRGVEVSFHFHGEWEVRYQHFFMVVG